MVCHASVNATASLPDKPKRYSAEGTLAHSVSERCRDYGCTAEKMLGEKHAVDGFDLEVDKQMVDGVNVFLEYVRDIGGDWFNEARVQYTDYVHDGFGTADHITVTDSGGSSRTVHVVDLKYGEGVRVDAKDNPQLMLYALGFLCTYSWMFTKNSLNRFKIHIVQPRLDHIDTVEFGRIELMTWVRKTLIPAYEETLKPDAKFVAGEHCQFCKLRLSCAERARARTADLTGELENLDVQIDRLPSLTMPSQDITLTNDQLAKLLAVKPLAVKFWEDLAKHARNELREGRPVGDWKLVSGKSARVLTVPEDEAVMTLELEGFAKEDLYSKPELKSVAQLEEVVGKKNETLKLIYKKIPGAPTLAPGKDKRPAIEKLDAATEFEALDSWDSDDE